MLDYPSTPAMWRFTPKPRLSILKWSKFGSFGGGSILGNLHVQSYIYIYIYTYNIYIYIYTYNIIIYIYIYHSYPIEGSIFTKSRGKNAGLLVEMIRHLEQPRGHRGSVSEAIGLKGGWKVGLWNAGELVG